MDSDSSRLTITATSGARHLVLAGDIDSFTAPDLESSLVGLTPTADVTVELSGVGFIDSSGLRVLIMAHTALAEQGHRLVLVSPSRAVARLFDISGLTGQFNLG